MRLMGDPVMAWLLTLNLPLVLGLLRILRVFAAIMSTVFGDQLCHPQINSSSCSVEGLFWLDDCCTFVIENKNITGMIHSG